MLRTLLTWRWVALTAVLVAAVAGMVWLGQWQWGRSAPESTRPVADPTTLGPADVAALPRVQDLVGVGALPLQRDPGRLVVAEGRWVPERTLLLADRDGEGGRAGEPGRWVVTAVRLDGTVDGHAGVLVPVVRGWVPADPGSPAAPVPAPPTGPVRVVGWLQAPEPLDLPVDIVQPEGVVPLLATADLVNRWPEELVGGFVVQAAGAPGAEGPPTGPAADQPVPLAGPPDAARVSRDWRNLAYSLQWFVFAGFAVVLWARMLRDDVARQEAAAEAAALERRRAAGTQPEAGRAPVPTERSAP
ncbi:SURF1 family protein [Aquipuribacter sp. SD81]|uniref:SURF1 family protein n=1 Tax=Aquipuribacter sp. SD81 TaxID=3127703 RepID=UPI003015C1AA